MSWTKYDIWNTSLVKRLLESQRIAQSYLFLGPDQQKKIWIAMAMAKALFCQQPGASFCDSCPSCRKIENHNHPDVFWLRPSGKMRVIKMDMVRSLQSSLALKSYEGGRKIAFILEADNMREDASNAMLKTIEEPVANTILVLMASDIERILPTIISRCQQIFFPLSTNHEIHAYLTNKQGCSPDKASLVAALSRGNYSLASRYVDDERRQWRDFAVTSFMEMFHGNADMFTVAVRMEAWLNELVKKTMMSDEFLEAEAGVSDEDAAELLSDMELKALEKGVLLDEARELFQFFESCIRDAIVYKETHDKASLFNQDSVNGIAAISASYSIQTLKKSMEYVEEAYRAFCGNMNLRFVLEILFDRLGSSAELVS